MKQTLLIISGGLEAVPGIQTAKEMGMHVVISDINADAPGFALADDTILASTYDIDATVESARRYHTKTRPLDGVMCIASDVPLTVASVADALDLPGISIDSARLATDKLAMKQQFLTDGIPVPLFTQIESEAHLRKLIAQNDYPLVLKPVDSRGARGVLRLSREVDPEWAYRFSLQYSPTRRVMLERFLSGPQVSTESIVLNGVAYTPGFSDRNYEFLDRFAPHIIENGGELPSHLPEEQQQAVRTLVQQAARSMGISNGVVKGDIVLHQGKPYVIELAARLSGGYFCTHEIPLNTGVDFVQQAITLALGEKIRPEDLQPHFQQGVAQRYLFPSSGKVVHIEGDDVVAQQPEIAFCDIRVKVGSVIGPMHSHPARAGVLISTGDTREKAIEYAERAIKGIQIRTIPL